MRRGLLLLWAAAGATACTSGVDYANGDLPRMPLPLPPLGDAAAAAVCASMCAAEPQCVLSVLLPAGCDAQTPAPVCYLKGAVTAPTNASCRCSAPVARAAPPAPTPGATRFAIRTADVAATFGDSGLLTLAVGSVAVGVRLDTWALALDGVVLNSSALPPPVGAQPDATSVRYDFTAPPYAVSALYEARPGWRFVRKTLTVAAAGGVPIIVGSVSPWDALLLTLAAPLVGTVFPTGDLGTYGVFARLADGTGALAAVENPFLLPTAAAPAGGDGRSLLVHVGFHPALVWDQTTAAQPAPSRPYVADGGVLALYALGPRAVPPAVEADSASPRYVPSTPPYAGAAATHATDTHAGMRVEYVPAAGGGGDGGAALPRGVHGGADPSWLNYAERDAFRAVAEAAFLLPPAAGTLTVHVPWTENDYQIDIANATQWPQYERILTQLSRIGVDRLLYAGGDSAVSAVANCTDDWCWENVLWLNYGERIRAGAWVPGSPLHPTVARLVNTSRALGVSAIPYVYPILGFTGGAPGATPPWWEPQANGHSYSTLASRDFQDYFVALTVNFSAAVGAFGAGYDYTYLFSQRSTQYAQWAGWRRILRLTREALGQPGMPTYAVDNRQASHEWSPWMWAAGSYAEPLQSDEQTTSWSAFVQDLHIDRTDGNRQREMNYDYAQSKLCQPSAMPGFMHHNTDRGDNRRTDLNVRDFDFYGAPYTIISAIGTGGLNAVVCDIPARDAGEFDAFPAAAGDGTGASVAFYRTWLGWARAHAAHLRRLQFLPSPPRAGAVDGTYAMVNGSGFVFLFNPNAEAAATPDGLLTADAPSLDVACAPGDVVAVTELWPVPGPVTTVACGANFSVALEGRSARVLTVAPSAPPPDRVTVIGRAARPSTTAELVAVGADAGAAAAGTAGGGGSFVLRIDGDVLDVAPPDGAAVCADGGAGSLYALVPERMAAAVSAVRVAGVAAAHAWMPVPVDGTVRPWDDRPGSGGAACWRAPRSAAPAPAAPRGFRVLAISPPPPRAPTFEHGAPVSGMAHNASFAGGRLAGTVRVPQAVFDQLAARAAAYPVPWTSDDADIAWLAPGRLLLHVHVARALPATAAVTATLGGAPVPVRPCWSCRSVKADGCFQGFWIDASAVPPGEDVPLVLALPPMAPGAFGGVYYENVDTIFGA